MASTTADNAMGLGGNKGKTTYRLQETESKRRGE